MTSTFTCLVVDDEPIARKVILSHLKKIQYFECVATLGSALEINSHLQKHQVDVLFLDINMPTLSGMNYYKQLQDPPLVVFTTAHPEYAIEAFEVRAFDYLVKPISFARFHTCTSKLQSELANKNPGAKATNWINIREGKRIYRLNCDEIHYLQAYGDYVRVFTDKKTFMVLTRLSIILKELPDYFIQIHRSYVVSAHSIQYVEGNMLSISEEKIPISASYKNQLQEWLS